MSRILPIFFLKYSMNDFKSGFIAGNISGLGQIVFGHPLDTLKTRLQNHNPYYHNKSLPKSTNQFYDPERI